MGNGQPPPLPRVPRSIRTIFHVANGQHFAIDEDIHAFTQAKNEFLADETARDLWLTMDHRPICFSRALIEAFGFATVREVEIETVDEPDVVRHLNRQGR